MKRKIRLLIMSFVIVFASIFTWNVLACDMEFIPTCKAKLIGTFNSECVYTVTCETPEGDLSTTFRCECGSGTPEQTM